MSGQTNDPWDRRPGEGPEAFAAASGYFARGPERSIEAVAQEFSKSGSLLRRWSSRYGWVERAAAYDSHIAAVRQASREAVAAREAAKWERRRHAALESVYRDARALRSKARQMLAVAVTEEAVGPGGVAVVKPTGRWSISGAAQMLRVAAELEAGALGAATRPLEQLSDAELEAIANVFPGCETAEEG